MNYKDLPRANNNEPIHPERMKICIDHAIEIQEWNCKVYYALKTVVEKFHGKALNKRLITALKEALPDDLVFSSTDHYITVWKNSSSENKFELWIKNAFPQKIVDFAAFCNLYDIQYRNIEAQTVELKNLAKSLVPACEKYNDALAAMQKAQQPFQCLGYFGWR